jgi:DNA-binding beta-propeller fold protein YncE
VTRHAGLRRADFRQPASALLASALLALAAVLSTGCFRPDDGREPPLDRIYFPTGLALSPDGNRLYVANSDWDLQFNAGSVQVYDAAALRARVPQSCETDADCAGPGQRCQSETWVDPDGVASAPTYWCIASNATEPCGELGVRPGADRFFEPGLCGPLDNREPGLMLDSVNVGAFATDLIYRSNPAGGGRVFVPVRSDATLHWIDVRGDAEDDALPELECGQRRGSECDSDHRRGDGRSEAAPSGLGLPIEPFGIAADAQGEVILVTHQTERDVSLFTNDWTQPESGPELTHVIQQLPSRPVQVTAIPVPEVARLDREGRRQLGYQPGFWVTFRGNPFVQLLRYFDEVDASDGQPYLESAFSDRLDATSGSDVRSMAVDASRRSTCEAGCAGDADCLGQCASIALDVYLANRSNSLTGSPAALLVGTSTSMREGFLSNDRLSVSDVVPLEAGPTRVVVGDIRDELGQPSRRVFVSSFDGRAVTVYDPAARSVDVRILTGRGPTAIALDPHNALAYVAHFTDSYIGVIDLDRRNATYGTMLLTLGLPTAPRGDR